MGSKFAPIYATLVLAYLEENLKKSLMQISENTSKPMSKDS